MSRTRTASLRILGIIIVLLLCVNLPRVVQSQPQTLPDDLAGVNVAVYADEGVMVSSRDALISMFI